MLNPELLFEVDVVEMMSPTAAKPAIPREAPIRREDPEIPNPTIPRIPIQEPDRRPVPQEPRIPTPQL